jgi:hypothetical protein
LSNLKLFSTRHTISPALAPLAPEVQIVIAELAAKQQIQGKKDLGAM